MKAIKWIGGLQFWGIGALTAGRIVTEAECAIEVMASWVAQGWAEWYEAQVEATEASVPAIVQSDGNPLPDFDPTNHTYTIKEPLKKSKIKGGHNHG